MTHTTIGVLVGSDGEQLEQVITDEGLAPARVARRDRTSVASAPDAIGTLVAMAITEDRRIVGWSYFDRRDGFRSSWGRITKWMRPPQTGAPSGFHYRCEFSASFPCAFTPRNYEYFSTHVKSNVSGC